MEKPARLRSAAAQNVIAPDFLLDKTLEQIRLARGGKVAAVVAGDVARADAPRTCPAISRRAPRKSRPARSRPRSTARSPSSKRIAGCATGDAGVWKLPRGDEYYAWALRAGTTTRMTPDEIHQRGQEELRALQSEMDAHPQEAGNDRQGPVGERMTALGKAGALPRSRKAMRAARSSWRISTRASPTCARACRARSRRWCPATSRSNAWRRRSSPARPAPTAAPARIDGKVPGKFWINMHTMSVFTTYNTPTLTYHESIPGHVWQGEYTFKLPLARSLLAFNAYSEGWALYAEQLANELGVYDDDPFGRLGYLQSIAFRACRLVVDTGLHAKRWTRQQAIDWFASTNGSSVDEVTGEVDRYCAWPGQACGYKVGHSEINRLRAKAQTALGSRFDLRRFNDAVVTGGGVPMLTLARIDRHVHRRGRPRSYSSLRRHRSSTFEYSRTRQRQRPVSQECREQLANPALPEFLNQIVVAFAGCEVFPSNSMSGAFFQSARADRLSRDARSHSTSLVKPRWQMTTVSWSVRHEAQPGRARQKAAAPAIRSPLGNGFM